MANGEIKNENMLTAFKEMHKVAGMDPSYLYEMLVNGRSAEEVMRQSFADRRKFTDEDPSAGGREPSDEFLQGIMSDVEGIQQDDVFADEIIDYGRMLDELTEFSEAYPVQGSVVDPYIKYLQELLNQEDLATTATDTTTDELPVVNPNDSYQPWGFTWLGSTQDDRKMWEYDKTIAKDLANFREEILPLLTAGQLELPMVLASMKRLQNLVRLGDRGQSDYRDAILTMRPWLQLDAGGRMVEGTPGAEEFNAVVEQVRNVMVTDELGGSKWDDIMSNLNARIEKLGAAYRDPGRMTGGSGARPEGVATTYAGLPQTDFDVVYKDQSNRGLFMNELNKIPGSGTFEMERNKDDMWQQAETVYLLGHGASEDEIQVQGGKVYPDFGETFTNWTREWLKNPQAMTEEYNTYRDEGYKRGDPQGLALKAHQHALQMMEMEKGLESISVDGGWYNLTEWMRNNPNKDIQEWFREEANKKLNLDVLDPAPDATQYPEDYREWKDVYDKFQEAYNNTLGKTAGLFHPKFSGNTHRWQSLYTVPNTIGMDPRAAIAIRRQLNMVAATMRERGMTHGEIAERLTRQTIGLGLEEQAKETGQEWVQGPLPTNMGSADTEAQVSAPAYQKDTPVVAYAGDPLDTDPEAMTPRTNY